MNLKNASKLNTVLLHRKLQKINILSLCLLFAFKKMIAFRFNNYYDIACWQPVSDVDGAK